MSAPSIESIEPAIGAGIIIFSGLHQAAVIRERIRGASIEELLVWSFVSVMLLAGGLLLILR